MPQPHDAASASDTALEHQFSVTKGKQMQAKADPKQEDVDGTSILGPAFSAFGRKLMLVVVGIALIALIGILVLEEMERFERSKIRQVPVAPGESSSSFGRSSIVVTKENWKTLQDKADKARRQRLRNSNPRARAIQERAEREAKEREHTVIRQLEHEMHNTKSSHTGGWASKTGGPHSGAANW